MPSGVYKRTPEMKTGKNPNSHHFGKENPTWKGDKAKYTAKHMWVRYHFGKANHCEECGKDKENENKKRTFCWANLSHKYTRKRKDWKQMCYPCHKIYDLNF